MALPIGEPIREQIVESFFEALLEIKNDTAGDYYVRPKDVRRQPIYFDACKVYPTYFCVDGDQVFEGKPGGDHKTTFPVLVFAYSKDAENVSRHRSRIIRDIIVAVHVDRDRGDQLVYDTRLRRLVHDNGVLAPLTWVLIEWEVDYRMDGSEV